jgi:hypothetical protein
VSAVAPAPCIGTAWAPRTSRAAFPVTASAFAIAWLHAPRGCAPTPLVLPRSDSDDRGPRCAAGGRPSRRRPAVRRPVASSSRALPTPRAGWPSASGHLEARRRRHRAGRVRHGGSIPARRSGPADRRDFVVTSPPTPTPADRERSVAVVDLPLGRIGRLPLDARSGDALPDRPYGTSEHRTGVKVPNCGALLQDVLATDRFLPGAGR